MSFEIVSAALERKWATQGVKLGVMNMQLSPEWIKSNYPSLQHGSASLELLYDNDSKLWGFTLSDTDTLNSFVVLTHKKGSYGASAHLGKRVMSKIYKSGYIQGQEVIPYQDKENPSIFVLPKT